MGKNPQIFAVVHKENLLIRIETDSFIADCFIWNGIDESKILTLNFNNQVIFVNDLYRIDLPNILLLEI